MGRDKLIHVVTTEDYLCGRCGKCIHKGGKALRGEVELLNSREKPITVAVFYHPGCQPQRPRQIREPQIDPNVARRKRKKQW